MKLTYNVEDKPTLGKTIVFALQQLLAILAATIAVPSLTGHGMSQSAALFGAGVGTLVYLLFTKFKSPVFLGSSFAFLGSMAAAFAGGVSAEVIALSVEDTKPGVTDPTGYLGLIIGAALAGLVYVVISLVVKFCGVKWISKLMPAVVIGPTVAIIGLSLAVNAIGDLTGGENTYVSIICGLITLAVTMLCSVFGKKFLKTIPFIVGIGAGYLAAVIFTLCGVKVIDFQAMGDAFKGLNDINNWIPEFTFIKAFKGGYDFNEVAKNAGYEFSMASYIGTIFAAYVPVAFVVFAEHIADHKNLSSIIEKDLLEDPGLHRTLLGDGVGSMAGAFFGGCPNTTYGESVGCVAISGNASIRTIFATAILAIVASFIAPFTIILKYIPACVMGGVCVALYGFIAVSGLKMIQNVDLGNNRNLFVVSVILIAGVGGMSVSFGKVTITEVACALILGILTNLMLAKSDKKDAGENNTEEDK